MFRGRGQGQLRCAPAVDGDSAALRDGHGLIATSKQCGVLSDTGHEGRRVEARPADLARHAASVAFGALFFLIGDHQTGHQLTVAVGAACYAARARLDRHRNACVLACLLYPPFPLSTTVRSDPMQCALFSCNKYLRQVQTVQCAQWQHTSLFGLSLCSHFPSGDLSAPAAGLCHGPWQDFPCWCW